MNLAAEAVWRGLCPPLGDQLTIKPGGAVAADLALEVEGRQQPHLRSTALGGVECLGARGEILGNAPSVIGEAFDNAGSPQSLQTANTRLDQVAAVRARGKSQFAILQPLLVIAGAIDASFGESGDGPVRWPSGGSCPGLDHSPDRDAGGAVAIDLDMTHPAIDAIDNQPHAVVQFIDQTLVDHPADLRRGRLAARVDDHRLGRAGLAPTFERPAHGLDDVAALAKRLQGRLDVLGQGPDAGLDLLRQPHALQGLQSAKPQGRVGFGADLVLRGPQVEGAAGVEVGDHRPVDTGQALAVISVASLREISSSLSWPSSRVARCSARWRTTCGDVVLGNDQIAAAIVLAADHHMAVRVAGVEVIDRHPVQTRAQVTLHLVHQLAGEGAHVRKFRAVLRGDDEPELVTIAGSALREVVGVHRIGVRVIEARGLAISANAVADEIAEMSAGRLRVAVTPSITGI